MRNGLLISFVAFCTAGGTVLAQPPARPLNVAAAEAPPAIEKRDALPATGAASCPADCSPACPECTPCGPPGRFWVSAEYLYWWTKGLHISPLVTSGSATDTIPGALGQPGTRVLFGGEIESEGHSGGRLTAGFWLNECQTVGIEVGYFFLTSRSEDFIAGGSGAPGSPVIARPFLDIPPTGAAPFQNSEIVAFPGAAAGTVSVHSTSRLQGAEANGLFNLCCCDNCCRGYRVDLLAGARWLQLNECVTIAEAIAPTSALTPAFVPGSRLTVVDQFCTENDFFGGQVGVRGEWRRDRFFVNARALVGLGSTHQHATIIGSTTVTPPGGAPTVVAGGLLAQPSNIGSRSRDAFSFVPELGINVGYQVTDHVRAFVGYTFLYWDDVTRPGDIIDGGVNPTQLPSANGPGRLIGPARPAFQFRDSAFWAQGVNVGVEFRF